MNELIPITTNENQEPCVSGRMLHEFLSVGTEYMKWFERMIDYGFSEGQDFSSFLTESSGGRPATDHVLKLDMAKELCMIQRSEKGKAARHYFIQVEKDFNSPEKVMARALRLADLELQNNKVKIQQLEAKNEASCLIWAGGESFRRQHSCS